MRGITRWVVVAGHVVRHVAMDKTRYIAMNIIIRVTTTVNRHGVNHVAEHVMRHVDRRGAVVVTMETTRHVSRYHGLTSGRHADWPVVCSSHLAGRRRVAWQVIVTWCWILVVSVAVSLLHAMLGSHQWGHSLWVKIV